MFWKEDAKFTKGPAAAPETLQSLHSHNLSKQALMKQTYFRSYGSHGAVVPEEGTRTLQV